jgi:hypothetical protein
VYSFLQTATFENLKTHALTCRDVDDHEWRPTFYAEMKTEPTSREGFLNSRYGQLILGFVQSVGELDHPKKALKVVRDQNRLDAFCEALRVVQGKTFTNR